MLHKLKFLTLSFLSLFMTFNNNQKSIKLNASNDLFEENVINEFNSSNIVQKDYIEEFFINKENLNSSLNPKYDEKYDGAYQDLYYTDYTNNPRLEWYVDDVLFDYNQKETFSYIENGEEITITSSFIDRGNTSGYVNPDLSTCKYYDENKIVYDGFYNYDDMSKKTALSSVNGVSLISNDIYINTFFDSELKEKNNIDIALKNESNFNINWKKLLNILSKSSNGLCFQYPLVKVDGNEYVNVIFNGGSAYIVTHNCKFYISKDNDVIYLSLPYSEHIEKITLSVPFFTGGFNYEKTLEVPSDYDGVNNIVTAYAVGENIINEMNEVMTSFKPYLWNNESNDSNADLIHYSPLQVSEFINSDNMIIFRSPIYLEFTCNDIRLHNLSFLGHNFTNLDINDSGVYDYAYCNYVNGYKSSYYEKEYNYYYVKHNNDLSRFIGTIEIDSMNFETSTNENYVEEKIDFDYYKSIEKFKCSVNRSAYIIWGDYKYHIRKNGRKGVWSDFPYSTYKIPDGGGDYNFGPRLTKADESYSYRQFVYFDFFWDEGLTKKIQSIDSVYCVMPLVNNQSVILNVDNIQNSINNPFSDNYVFYRLYDSDITDYYNEFFMPTKNSLLYNETYSEVFGTLFLKYGHRFMYSHYLSTDENYDRRLDFNRMDNDNTSTYAQLRVMVSANEIVKCTTAVNGSHIEYDDYGNVLGVYNQYGELEEDLIVNENGYIVDSETGLAVKNNYYSESVQDYYDELTDRYNWLDGIGEFFTSIGDFFSSNTFKGIIITLISITGLILITALVIKIIPQKKIVEYKQKKKKRNRKKIKHRKK